MTPSDTFPRAMSMLAMPDSTPSPRADGDGDVDMDAGIGPTALDFEGGDAGDDMEP